VSLSVDVSCLPGKLPASIEADVSGLALDAHLAAKDLVLPADLTLLTDALQVICTCKAVVEREPEEDEPAEPELIREKRPDN